MRGASFPRRARLTEPSQFRRVFSGAFRSGDPLLTVLARENGQRHPRLGLAIARKTLRRAVDRNRVKRLIRESFRLNAGRLPAVDIVVLARPGLQRRSNREIVDSLTRHWVRITAGFSAPTK